MRQQDITSLNFAFPTNRRMIVSRCCGMISAWSLLQHNAPILGLTPIFARMFHSWPWKSYVAVATCHSNCFTRFKKVQCWRLTHSVISVGPQLLCGRFWIQSMVILQVRMLSALLNVSHIDRHSFRIASPQCRWANTLWLLSMECQAFELFLWAHFLRYNHKVRNKLKKKGWQQWKFEKASITTPSNSEHSFKPMPKIKNEKQIFLDRQP